MAKAQIRVARTDEKRDYKTIEVAPLTPVLGAEVEGLDLTQPLDDEQLMEVKQAFADHSVLVFRDQEISREDHKRFAGYFGTLHTHPYHKKGSKPGHAGQESDPNILPIIADQNSRYVAGEGWHSDVTCDEEPPFGSMLYITETPEIGAGGDTCFISAYEAYETLSPAMKAFLDGLDAVHDGAKPYSGSYGIAAPEGGWPRTKHPVITRHPETGRKLLYVNRGFTTHIDGLAKAESDALLEMLWRHLEVNPVFQCRVRWTPNTLTFWDNRCVQHHAVWDYYPYSRRGERVSIVGGRPSR
ncbi:TauD/TfdA family dioxygenase [Parvibaculum sp.]|uniref:TauD/TfdA dioxygenase family protein n=1 Tax=Parvibaculum sp. TaxID=2024848 RepID=UPI000C983F85|nr:TauD/TfdA family dioxygenase [Parvibaculum sp.]MAB13725.1 taurine dioxygenase [Parvibaculum sp.]